jgi:TPR repeat protein
MWATSKKFVAVAILFFSYSAQSTPQRDAGGLLEKRIQSISFATLIQKAQMGDPQSQYELAIAYDQGLGEVRKNQAYALSWYEEAARNGVKAASDKLRAMNMSGPE